jgi:hypothetical protein
MATLFLVILRRKDETSTCLEISGTKYTVTHPRRTETSNRHLSVIFVCLFYQVPLVNTEFFCCVKLVVHLVTCITA